MGIEPTLSAWKAEVLPLNYTRLPQTACLKASQAFEFPPDSPRPDLPIISNTTLVEGVGFEPT